ncbi:MAG: DUF362 domain-containing protein [Tissierellaceae bacterium]|nr:DUF362 domain-containing protein [Tissierellaceae bacterium]
MSKVIIQECTDYSVEEIMKKINSGINNLGGWDKFVKLGDTVLLKANLIGPKSSDSAAVTHSEFIRALTRILKNMGCTIWIGDSSGGAIAGIAPTAQSFKVSGYEKVSKEEGAIIKNFDKEGVFEVVPKGKFKDKMYLAKPLIDADVVINVPKLKTHSSTIYTGAVKNVFGCIPGLRKAMYHKIAPDKEDFGEILTDIHEGAKFHLHIMDGIVSMEGDGPTAGSPYNANKILISTDPLALDTVAIKMLGMDIQEIDILSAARKTNLGEWDLNKITVDGDYNSKSIPVLRNYKLPKKYKSTKKRNSKAVIKVVDFFKTRPFVNMKKCKSCNICVESCPIKVIDIKTKKIDYDQCIECMCCHELCMHKAVELKNDNVLAGIISKVSIR